MAVEIWLVLVSVGYGLISVVLSLSDERLRSPPETIESTQIYHRSTNSRPQTLTKAHEKCDAEERRKASEQAA